MSNFAKPISQLAKIGVTAAPSGGMGLALTPDGKIPGETLFVQPGQIPTARRIAFGTGSITWPGGSPTSNNLTVNHGLGTTPVVVFTSTQGSSGLTAVPALAVTTYTSTTFLALAWTVDNQNPLNTAVTFINWIAIG